MATSLVVGLCTDVDEPADGAGPARQTFENIHALPMLNAIFERHAVRPTYLVSWPVAVDERSQEVLRFLRLRGHCEIGAHHRAWETPPCPSDGPRLQPTTASLGADQYEAQLAELTAAIARAVGEPPVSYRSARFGFAAAHLAVLERYGYLVESSVAPGRHEADVGHGFVEAPLAPYFLSYDSVARPGTSRVLEIPCSAGPDRDVPFGIGLKYARARWPRAANRILPALGLGTVQWLRPSSSSLEAMCALARRLVERGVPVLNVLAGSNEAVAGAHPSSGTTGEREAFLERLERFLGFAVKELGARPATFREFYAGYVASVPITLPSFA